MLSPSEIALETVFGGHIKAVAKVLQIRNNLNGPNTPQGECLSFGHLPDSDILSFSSDIVMHMKSSTAGYMIVVSDMQL